MHEAFWKSVSLCDDLPLIDSDTGPGQRTQAGRCGPVKSLSHLQSNNQCSTIRAQIIHILVQSMKLQGINSKIPDACFTSEKWYICKNRQTYILHYSAYWLRGLHLFLRIMIGAYYFAYDWFLLQVDWFLLHICAYHMFLLYSYAYSKLCIFCNLFYIILCILISNVYLGLGFAIRCWRRWRGMCCEQKAILGSSSRQEATSSTNRESVSLPVPDTLQPPRPRSPCCCSCFSLLSCRLLLLQWR